MPVASTSPGVFIDEVPSGVHTIAGVATSITAFIGRTLRGPTNKPVTIGSFADFEQTFGGLWLDNALGYAVRDFFLNGGSQAIIVRLYHPDPGDGQAATSTSDGAWLTVQDFLPMSGELDKQGLYALEQADLFNILCIPPYHAPTDMLDIDASVVRAAASYCEKRRAMLLVDAPKDWTSVASAKDKFADTTNDNVGAHSRNAALYFPRLQQPNPLRDNRTETFASCGAVAGIYARTDTNRGVWKAPAGLDAPLVSAPALSVVLTDAENGELNRLGINCLREFPAVGRVIWGARTLRGADQFADEYKYVPVRRTALYIEESLYRGTQWVVFEPNGEPLWAQIRLNVGAFMNDLFHRGAFQGTTPHDAYFVKCDKETTTQDDIGRGIVNIVVGFAPLKPGEFVIIQLQQIAGQIAA